MKNTIQNSRQCVYLIDGSAYIYRAFHAVRGLTNSKGMPTNAVFGFTRMLLKLVQDRHPLYVAVFFDAKGPTFRHRIYPQYKANRPPMPDDLVVQLPFIKQVTDGFNIPAIEADGYEADDLIGTCARQAEAAGFQVVMVTGDKDFMQLVTPESMIWDPMKDNLIDLERIYRDYGLEPRQMIDVMGLSGDTADNIPGVPGVGPKTAVKLIRTFGDMDSLYGRLDEVSGKKLRRNLAEHKDQAYLSRRLVTIDTQAPVEFEVEKFRFQEPDRSVLGELFGRLEFRQLRREYGGGKVSHDKHYHSVLEPGQLEELVEKLAAAEVFALDTETTSTDPMKADLVGVSVALEPHRAYYIPCGHRYLGAPRQIECMRVLELLRPVLESPKINKVGQNIKYDWIVLKRHGVELDGVIFDTMLASYLLNPSKRAHNLDQIALDFLDYKTTTYSQVAGKGKAEVGFEQVAVEKAAPYACEDADVTFLAYRVLKQKLEKYRLVELMETVELPLVPVLVKMEMAGVAVDQERLRQLSKLFEHQMEKLETAIYELAGERFNIRSSQQLGRILFEKLKLPVVKKTRKKTGFSTDVEVLTRLAESHELPAVILRHRGLAKLKSTYVDALLELINPETGRIHTSFNQTVTATGRLSSSDPNLQNIPIRTEEGREIRKAFVARPGWCILSADYSQIELRILAHCADDPILIEAFHGQEDIHARTAAEVFRVDQTDLSPELRRQAKAINFGIIYGMSAYGLSKELGISNRMAQTYIDNYFERYQGVKAYIDQTITKARRDGRISTLLGRVRLLPEINSSNRTVRRFAERTAVNTPIQGTAADLIKLAMIRLDQVLVEKKLAAVMILSVHDEIVLEVPEKELEQVKDIARKVMENIWELKVPLKVNLAWGANWAEAH